MYAFSSASSAMRFSPPFFDRKINSGFSVTGEEYARSKGSRSEIIDRWYNRKRLGMELSRDFGGDILSPNLPELLADNFGKLLPMYDFFMEIYREEPGNRRS